MTRTNNFDLMRLHWIIAHEILMRMFIFAFIFGRKKLHLDFAARC